MMNPLKEIHDCLTWPTAMAASGGATRVMVEGQIWNDRRSRRLTAKQRGPPPRRVVAPAPRGLPEIARPPHRGGPRGAGGVAVRQRHRPKGGAASAGVRLRACEPLCRRRCTEVVVGPANLGRRTIQRRRRWCPVEQGLGLASKGARSHEAQGLLHVARAHAANWLAGDRPTSPTWVSVSRPRHQSC